MALINLDKQARTLMGRSINKDTIVDIGFYGGLALKAINALLEFIGGLLLMIISNERLDQIIQLIALPVLREEPNHTLMNYLVIVNQSFSSSTQNTVAIFMLLHGMTKLAVIWPLWKKKLWAYPPAVGVFGLFVAYEIVCYMQSPSVLLPVLIIIDAAIIVMIILEYQHLKKEQQMRCSDVKRPVSRRSVRYLAGKNFPPQH